MRCNISNNIGTIQGITNNSGCIPNNCNIKKIGSLLLQALLFVIRFFRENQRKMVLLKIASL